MCHSYDGPCDEGKAEWDLSRAFSPLKQPEFQGKCRWRCREALKVFLGVCSGAESWEATAV